ncbi:spindle assembly checkpoint kinase [Rhizophlyctis rosea]|uniref:Spindle assembly checkpoint kinase n=1 Tax=Rhizophlyctis rosea TaxID=64517 RepID=A0AAD5X272_9FUNG|nr:spindle assembly checkpoint kinase [Rhizophlyctis rosea]
MPALPSLLPATSHLQKRAPETSIPLYIPIILGVIVVLLLIALLTLYNLFRRQLARIARKSTVSDAAAVYKYSTDETVVDDDDEKVTPHPRDGEAPPKGIPYFFFEDILMMDHVDHVKSGGFAMVAKGRFVGTAAQQVGYNYIAIKTLKVRGLRGSELKKEIRNEVAIMLNVGTHPNVVHLYGITHVPIRNEPHISILMGWAKYGSLRSYAKSEREKRIDHQDWQWFYRLAKGMASGLRHLHQRKVLHHDISSNNVLVDAGGHVRWTDFGLSTYASHRTQQKWTGTVNYLPPEYLETVGFKYNFKCDIYGLGMLLWELTMDRIPYSKVEGDPHAVREAILASPDPFVPIPNMPQAWTDLVAELIARDPDNRPELDEVVSRLEELVNPGAAKSGTVGAGFHKLAALVKSPTMASIGIRKGGEEHGGGGGGLAGRISGAFSKSGTLYPVSDTLTVEEGGGLKLTKSKTTE